MSPKRKYFFLQCLPLFFAILSASLVAQPGYQFGQNKVHYKSFDWQVLRTGHFEVHYYSEAAETAVDAARMAERGYAYLSAVLQHEMKDRIPLILYASLNDFQQTNVVSDLLDDGTRGVTEGLRNRVVLPITGSYREFNHVLVHELVHAFQFDLIKNGEGPASLGSFNPPLWFVEGMAEYLSVGMDNITRMWVRDGLLNDDLLSVEKLGSTYDIRVYRLGESVWHFVGETYGKQKVGEIFKAAIQLGDIERAFKKHLDLDFKQLTAAWHEAARKQTLPADSTLQRPEEIAQMISRQTGYFHRINLVPSVSPDGRHVAYVANKNLAEEIYLLTLKENGEFEDRRLVKGGRSHDFESLRYFDTSINWSRDGSRIAFVSKSGKDDAIYVMNPFRDQITHKLTFEELNGLTSPSFSPDGNKLVFIGIRGGRSDLYLTTLRDGALERLTEDRFAELQPQWSPDGNSILFITDRGRGTDESGLLFGDFDLALYTLATGEIKLLTNLAGNLNSPQWSPDGREIFFVSDHQGIANVYRLHLASAEISPVTALATGAAGITGTTPAMSLSADGRVLVFSSFQKGGWQLFRMMMPHAEPAVTVNASPAPASSMEEAPNFSSIVVADSSWLPAAPEPNEFYAGYALVEEDSIEARNYSSMPKFTAASVAASFGGFYGTVGGAQFLFSDVLNNHNLIFSVNLRRALGNSDVGVAYLNQKHRINWGVEGFQIRNAFGVFATYDAAGFVTQTYRGLNAFAYLPFSRFSRLEVSAGATFVNEDLVVESIDYNGGGIRREKEAIGNAVFGQVGVALVHDNTIYGPLGPFSGRRSRFEVQRTTNDMKFTTFVADYRRYFNVNHRSVLAWRVLGGASFDRDAQVFRLGGSYTYRGADYGDVLGTRFLVQNLEYRFPLFPFLPPSADFLSAATFVDAATAWGVNVPGLVKESFQPFSTNGGFHLQDLRGAFGIGARFNLGYLVLKYDVAWPTDLQNIGKPIRLFSIGTDF